MSFKLWVDKQTVVHPYNGILPSNKMHELQIHVTTWMNLKCIYFLLQGIFPTQGSKPCLLRFLHWQADSLPLAPPGKPQSERSQTEKALYWIISFFFLFHYGLLQDIKYSSSCYTVGPCLSILYITVCIWQFQTPNLSLPQLSSLLVPQVCSLCLWACFCFINKFICVII